MTARDVHDLWVHPEGAGWAGRQNRGTFDTPKAAMAATEYPDPAQWQKSGSLDHILTDSIIDGAGRECSWLTISERYDRGPQPEPSGEMVTLRLVQYGETEIQVDAGLYAAAKADGKVDHLLDTWISDVETDTTVIEPDGTETNPYA